MNNNSDVACLLCCGTPCLIAVVIIIVIATIRGRADKARELRCVELHDAVKALPGFLASQADFGQEGDSGIAIDEANKAICLISRHNDKIDTLIMLYAEVLSAEILENGETVTVGGGLGVGLGAGMVVGAGASTARSQVLIVQLRVVVNDTAAPNHVVTFMNLDRGKGGMALPFFETPQAYCDAAIKKAMHWQALLQAVIRQGAASTNAENYASTPGAVSADDGFHTQDAVICENCARRLGRLEQACVFGKHVVCKQCYDRLASE
jgi:hypothetical protein